MSGIAKAADLVEITTVSVDKYLPQSERCAEFKRQIKNIYNYKCKGKDETFTIKASYANNGASIEECLRGMMA